jgi:hypothetical protein
MKPTVKINLQNIARNLDHSVSEEDIKGLVESIVSYVEQVEVTSFRS